MQLRAFTTKNGISFQADNADREEIEKDRPFCLFQFEDDFDGLCYFIGNYESFEAAFDVASTIKA